MERPGNYIPLEAGKRCRCLYLWQEADGSFWCCNAEGGPAIEADDKSTLLELPLGVSPPATEETHK